jgi:hypothetical protein
LELLVNDSEYNNFTGQKPIQFHYGIYLVSSDASAEAGEANLSFPLRSPGSAARFSAPKKKTTTTTTRRKKEKEGRLEVVALAPWYRRAGASALPRLCIVSPRWHLGIDDIVAMAHERSQASEFQVKKSNQRAFVGILRAKSEKEKENTWSSSAKKYFSVHCAPKTPRSARKKSA